MADLTVSSPVDTFMGSADQAAMRTNLGLGALATQAANAVAITGGTLAGLTGLAIRSTGAAFDLTFASAEVLTAGRTLSFSVGDAARTLTIPASGTVALLGTANTFTAAQLCASGTAALPAWSFSADPDTGIYSVGANNVGITVGGSATVAIDTIFALKSNVPLAWSQGNPAVNSPDLYLYRKAAASIQLGADHATTPTAQMFSAHNVTTGTGASLTVAGGTGTSAVGAAIELGGGISTTTGGSILFKTAAITSLATRLTIDSNGYINTGGNSVGYYTGAGTFSTTQVFASGDGATGGTQVMNLKCGTVVALALNNFVVTSGVRFDLGGNKLCWGNSGNTPWSYESSGVVQAGDDAATPTTQCLKAHDGSGTDKAGADFQFNGGKSTGAGTPGSVLFQTSSVGSTGSSLNAYVTRMTIATTGITIGEGTDFILGTTTGSKWATAANQKQSFWGATPIVQPTVTGSRTAGTALMNLLSTLATLGLIVDSTSA